jgi:O-antigen ligase
MHLNKNIYNYFLILFSLIPVTIIAGSAVAAINILLLDFSFIILIIYKKNFYFLKNKTIIYFFILYIYLIFNSFISIDYSEGVIRNIGFLRMIILFAAFNYFYQDQTFFKKVFKFWSIAIFIVMTDVFIESFFGKNILGYGGVYEKRIVSFFKDEPIVGSYLYGFYFIIIGFILNEVKNNKNYFFFLISIILLISIIFTGERASTLKTVLGFCIILLLYKNFNIKQKTISVISIIFLLCILIFSSQFLKIRFVNQIKFLVYKDNVYFNLYKSGFQVFENNKFFGVGNKNYRVATCIPEEIATDPTQNKNYYMCTTHPHQIYFELLSEHGLVGTFIILYIFYQLIFSKILRTISEKNYLKIGGLIYLTLIFLPIIPSGAFFSSFTLTLFAINLSIFYASDEDMNVFKIK